MTLIDAGYSFMRDCDETAEGLARLVQLQREIRRVGSCAVGMVRHDGKGQHGSKAAVDRGSGHSVFARAQDLGIILDPAADADENDPREIVVSCFVRSYAPPARLALRFEDATFAAGLHAATPKTALSKGVPTARIERTVLEVVTDELTPVGEVMKAVQKTSGAGEKKVRQILTDMVADGRIVREQIPHVRPFKEGYRLSGSADTAGVATATSAKSAIPA